uniref:C2H2-type domain-containing protein n=1 Tax=Trichogramma kaykai TaxID=54128 RepID=A0ABD2XNV8_9HYME
MAVSSAAATATATGIEVRESGRALSFHTEMPHLVSTGSGRLSTTVTLHPLPEGEKMSNSDKSDPVILQDNLSEHKLGVLSSKTHVCDVCQKDFTRKSNLLRHKNTIHNKKKDYEYNSCEQKFGREHYLPLQQKTVHEVHDGQKNYACDKCEKKFGHKHHLIKHKKTVHEGRKDFACDNCEKKFGREHHLLKHNKIVHEGQKDYACDKCEKKFGLKTSLFRHQRTVHEGCKDYACDKCEKKFGLKTSLFRHQRTVHEGCQKDYACDKCEKKFGLKISLLRHQKTVHEGCKDYACDKCEKKFGRKISLLRHQRTVHDGQKNYTCDRCEKKFGQNQTLLIHLKTVHEGRKDFACDKCKKKFGHKQNMLFHQRTVHEKCNDYARKNCEQTFGEKSTWIRHQKIVNVSRKDYLSEKNVTLPRLSIFHETSEKVLSNNLSDKCNEWTHTRRPGARQRPTNQRPWHRSEPLRDRKRRRQRDPSSAQRQHLRRRPSHPRGAQTQTSVLTLGRSTQFRFNNPVEAQHLKCQQQQQQAKGKPPVAPRKSPRSSSASCSSDADEPVNFLGKLSKFEMLARQTRQQANNVVSPKVFPPGSLTTSVPADQILPSSVQQQQQQQQQQQYQPYYHNNHAKSASFSTMGRSSPLQNVTNFERCRNEDDARQCKLTNQYNTNHNNSIYQNVDDSNADLMTRSLGRRWQEQIQPYRPQQQQQQQQYNNHHYHNHNQHHHHHHQRRAASSQELESTYNDENHNGNGCENVDNGYENGYENVFMGGGGGMSTDDIMSRSFHCQRDEDLNQFSRDFDMSQSLIVAKTTTHTEFLKLEQYGSNNGSRYNLQQQQQQQLQQSQQQQPQGQVVVSHRRAGSCDSYNNSAQNVGIPRQKSPKQPSPAYNREVRVPKQQSKHQQQHHYQNFFTLPSNKPSEPLYGRIMRPLSPESERDAQERMRRAYEQRMREHGEKVRREKAHLEEMLATCTDYERQTSSGSSNGKHVEQQQPRRKHEEETILLSAVGYQSPHLPYKKPTVGCRNGPRYSGRPKTPPPSEEEQQQHHHHHHQPPLPPPPPPLPATPESSDNCDDNKLLAATPNNNRAPQWPEQENGYAVVMKPNKQQNKVAACYPADSDNYNHLNDVSPSSSSQKFAPTTNETTTHERVMCAEPQIPQQQQAQKKQERNEAAAAPPLPEKTIKLTYHNYENFMPVINGNLSIYENIGASQHNVNGDATTAGNNNVNNNINEAVQSSQQQLVSNNNAGKRSLPQPPKKPARTAPERHNNLLESTKLDVSNDDLLEAIEQLSQLSKPRNSSGSTTTTPIADHYQTPVKRLNGDNSKRLNDEYGDRADNNKDDSKADEAEKEQQRAQLEDQDRGKYMEFLENEKQHILANMDSFKRSVAEIETQEEEISRELELEKALLSAEHESESLKLEQDEAELNRVQEKLRELEAEMAEDKAGQTQIQAEARQRVLVAQQACASLEEQLAEAEGRDDERDSDLANRLAAQTDQLETERKAFEDLEFHHLEEEASKLANREELQRYAEELRAKVDARRLQLEQLESQRSDIKTTVLKEAKSLERQKLAHLRRLEEGRNRLRTIDDELESLVKNVNDNLVAEKRSPSREDFDRISRVTSESPIVNNNEGSGLARKTIESLKEIERNRQLHLAKQGSQVISEERRRVEELKRRVQEEVRSQWEERKMNCTSLNSVESGEESSSYSTGPTEREAQPTRVQSAASTGISGAVQSSVTRARTHERASARI